MTFLRGYLFAGVCLIVLFVFTATALAQSPEMMATEEPQRNTFLEIGQLEYRIGDDEDTFNWEAQGWIGGDYNKAWLKSQGDNIIDGETKNAEIQLLYSRAIAAFWDLQIGGRYDVKPDPSRGYAVLGIEGLAPYFFEVDAVAFVSNKGDASARLEAKYELLLTQRLMIRPSVELNFAAQEVKELDIGPGLSEVELGLRVRYEIVREAAPYIGVSLERKAGRTADFARRNGEDVDDLTFVTGIRFWF
jgi:copper resistance protein B